jgi:hypothetical protein
MHGVGLANTKMEEEVQIDVLIPSFEFHAEFINPSHVPRAVACCSSTFRSA